MEILNGRSCLFWLMMLLPCMVSGQKANVRAMMADYQDGQHFNGAVLIAKKGKIDYLSYAGLANR